MTTGLEGEGLSILGLDPWRFAGMIAAFLIGGFVKGGVGFGMPLVTMAIMPNFISLELALAVNAIVGPTANIFQFVKAKATGEVLGRFWPVLFGVAIGAPVGASLVGVVDERGLMAAVGVIVLGFSLLSIRDVRLSPPPGTERVAGLATGGIAGFVHGLTTTPGPIFVLYLVSYAVERRVMLGALAMFFLCGGGLTAISYWVTGVLDANRLLIAALCLIPAFLGMRIGDWAMGKTKPELFRRAVLIALCILAANLIWKGISAL